MLSRAILTTNLLPQFKCVLFDMKNDNKFLLLNYSQFVISNLKKGGMVLDYHDVVIRCYLMLVNMMAQVILFNKDTSYVNIK